MSMTGPPTGVAAAPGHPPDLLEAERSYLVPWGAREAALVLLATLAGAAVIAALSYWHTPFWAILFLPVLAAGGLGVLFFRNPRRGTPTDSAVLLAPADGKVVEVCAAEEPEYIRGPALKVAIFLSIFDVHVNRAPCGGEVDYVRHRPGRHLDARDPRCPAENESRATGIRRTDPGGAPGVKILVRQVSGAIARRIICPLERGQLVERGRLMGMIKYGSRTELFVSAPPGEPHPEAQVRVGDRVKGGQTILYRLPGR